MNLNHPTNKSVASAKKRSGRPTPERQQQDFAAALQGYKVKPSRVNRYCDPHREVRSIFWATVSV